jgi:hypothetical protein
MYFLDTFSYFIFSPSRHGQAGPSPGENMIEAARKRIENAEQVLLPFGEISGRRWQEIAEDFVKTSHKLFSIRVERLVCEMMKCRYSTSIQDDTR